MNTNEMIDLSAYSADTQKLAGELATATLFTENTPSGSIMGAICTHDDGFLCEHRLKWILDRFESKV